MTDKFIYVAGATRGTGLETVRVLRAANRPVVALVRPGSDAAELESVGAGIVRGDVLDAASLAGSMDGAGAIINSVGGKRGEPRPDLDGVKNLVAAAREAGVRRFILVSAAGIGDSYAAIPERAHQFLGPVLEIKAQGEDYLRDSGLDYTIIRPGAMDSEPASGNGMLTDDPLVSGTIHRADLARLVVDCLDDPESVGRVCNAVDRELVGVTFF